jgi:hypothetical protein
MSKQKIGLIVVVCALVGASLVGAQVVIQSFQRQYLNSGLFSVAARETANVYVSLDDQPGQASAYVVLQLFDETGAEVAHDEGYVAPGQSLRLVSPGPGLFRAHAEVRETTLQFTKRRTAVGSIEVVDTITTIPRRLPSFNPVPPGERP